jgi:drug/metabolite transporter (DMT)-like permease
LTDDLLGVSLKMMAVVAVALYPVVTSLSLKQNLGVWDVLLLRFGVSGLIFVPYLAMRRSSITKRQWLGGLGIALLHGVGMACVAIMGLMFAPAAHGAILGPPTLAVWVVVFGTLFFGIRPSIESLVSVCLIGIGIVLLLAASNINADWRTLIGDALFVCAGAMGALNSLILQRIRWPPTLAAAFTCTFSGVIVVPIWVLAAGSSQLSALTIPSLLMHALFQGVLFGVLVSLAITHAIRLIGSHRSSALNALIPVLGVTFAYFVANERLSVLELTASVTIVVGVFAGTRRRAVTLSQRG